MKPIRVLPYAAWKAKFPNPSLKDLLDRYRLIGLIVEGYRSVGKPAPPVWIMEAWGLLA